MDVNSVMLEDKIVSLEPVEWQSLVFLQDDNFKISTDEEYSKVAMSLLNKSFIAPFYVWRADDGTLYCLDGKRRETVLRKILADGGVHDANKNFHPLSIPDKLSALFVKAGTMQEAASYVLSYSSVFGTITQEGLHDFLKKFELDFVHELPEINLPDFSEERFIQKFDVYGVHERKGELEEEELSEMLSSAMAQIIVKQGDIFQLGTGKIICGDSTKEETFRALLGDERAQMIYTDPPYNLEYKDFGGQGKTQHEDFAMGAGEMSEHEFMLFLRSYMANCVKYSVNGSLHYHWMDFRHIWHICQAADSPESYNTMKPKQICVWHKVLMANGSFYRAQHEFCSIFKNGDAKHKNNIQMQDRTRSNVWEYHGANSFGNSDREKVNGVSTGIGMLENHPTPKPVEMCADAILDVTDMGDIVLDCFSGSGSTLIATLETNRVFRGVEFEPKYVQLIINRYLKYCEKYGAEVNFAHLNGTLTLNDFSNGARTSPAGTTADGQQ